MSVVTELRHHLGCRYQPVQNNLSTSARFWLSRVWFDRLIGSLNNIPGISYTFLVPFPRYPVLSPQTKNSHSDDMGSPGPSQRILLEELRARPFDRIIFQFPQHKERNKARRGEGGVPFWVVEGWWMGGTIFWWMFSEYVSFVTGYQQYVLSEYVVLRDLGVSLTHAIILILYSSYIGVAIPSLRNDHLSYFHTQMCSIQWIQWAPYHLGTPAARYHSLG